MLYSRQQFLQLLLRRRQQRILRLNGSDKLLNLIARTQVLILIEYGNGIPSQPLLHFLEYLHLIVPNATSSLLHQPRVLARFASIRAVCVIPHLLFLRRDDRDGNASLISSAHSAYSVHIILVLGRHRHVDDIRQRLDIYASRRHIGANQEAHIAVLEHLEIVVSFMLRNTRMQRNARIRVLFARVDGAAKGASSTDFGQECRQIVAVQARAAKYQTLVHLERVDDLLQDERLQYLDRFRFRQL
mmetsp:Transcript_66799/g.106187  ORF Transcript_66799/g.106187 Transcript_66799/m.106187 type:complete len:244 (-) Transcript_66799:70-801(-)